MCRLLGISINRPADIQLSFHELIALSQVHSDGFGFAYNDNDVLTVAKDAASLWKSARTCRMTTVQSDTFLAHLRMASHGNVTKQNAHPFLKEHQGRHLAFAHNGTVSAVKAWQINQPCIGETDSEHAFQWLLDRLPACDADEFPLALQREGDKIREMGRFNAMLTDGKTIWVYVDDAIFILKRRGYYRHAKVNLRNAGVTIGLDNYKSPDECAVLVSSEPLSDESWRKVPQGTVLVLRHGRLINEFSPGWDSNSEHAMEYASLSELERREPRSSWKKIAKHRDSAWTIAAIHGGQIERHTERIAAAIAGYEHSLYCFLGLRDENARQLHVTSTRFECPELTSLQRTSRYTLSIHGQKDATAQCIYVGGKNNRAAQQFEKLLRSAGFQTRIPPAGIAGEHPRNFVNRTPEHGVQLEISLALRNAFFDEFGNATEVFDRFVRTIRFAITRVDAVA